MPALGAPGGPGGPGASAGQSAALPDLGPPKQRTLPLHAIDFAAEDARETLATDWVSTSQVGSPPVQRLLLK